MRRFRDIPIKGKVTLITLLTSCVAILSASTIFILADWFNSRNAVVHEVSAIAQIVGQNSAAAIVFDDPGAAREILSALESKPNIVSAVVMKADFGVVASFSRFRERKQAREEAAALAARARVLGKGLRHGRKVAHRVEGSIDVVSAVVLRGDRVGYVALRSDLMKLHGQAQFQLIVASVAALFSILIAVLLSNRLQRVITSPISQMVDVMNRVTHDQAYSVRAHKRGDDELGVLIDGFNTMLEQIQKNEHALAEKIRAEEANRAKSEFLANVSHELRTPLNAIIGFSEIMVRQEFGPLGSDRYRIYANDIKYSGRHLLGIINDLLDLTKAEAGKLTLDESLVDVSALIADCLRMLRESAVDRGIKIAFAIPAQTYYLRADERLLSQAVINLASNAIKFTAAGGSVVLSTSRTAGHGIDIAIQDTGIGIAPENLRSVREPFAQVANAFTRGHEGTGLGLPLVDQIMRLHGGELNIESELGKGTTVTARFPAERVIASPGSRGNPAGRTAGTKAAPPPAGLKKSGE